jgi:hypothetical protein
MKVELDLTYANHPPPVFLADRVKDVKKLFIFISSCAPLTDKTGLTHKMFVRLCDAVESVGNCVILYSTRHCGEACQKYRQVPRHAGKCDRYSQADKCTANKRIHNAIDGRFEQEYVKYSSPDLSFSDLAVVPVFFGMHAGGCLSADECLRMQFTQPSAYCAHLSMSNIELNATNTAAIFTAFGVPLGAGTLQAWLQEFSGNSRTKGSATRIQKSEAQAPDSEFLKRSDQRIPNGKDVYCSCTVCDEKKLFIRGNWRNHVNSKMHQYNASSARLTAG